MRIRLLMFALYRDLAGTAETEVEIPPGATARQVIDSLRAGPNGFARLPAEPAIAVNQEYASLDTVLHDGDEMALLPPVAGG
jgi:molybdopterin converting factor subunit 1